MRFLITGGCGFIGSRLVHRLLADGHEAVVLDDLSTGDRRTLPAGACLMEADIAAAADLLQDQGPLDGIFHLAAVSSVEEAETDPARARRVNVAGTEAIFKLASGAGNAPVVLASSAAVYGDRLTGPAGEAEIPRPLGVYGHTKLAAEEIAASAFASHGLPSIALRLFNVYGPWDSRAAPPPGVIATFSREMLAGNRITIQGDGRQQRDFIYIDDAVSLLWAAMSSLSRMPRHAVINGCTGIGTSIIDLAAHLSALSSQPLAWTHVAARPSDIPVSIGSPALAGQILRFYPKTRLREGLSQLIDSLAPTLAQSASER